MILLTVRYIWQLVKKEIQPALAMWVMFSIAVGMSLITYLAEGNFGFLDNILNTVDVIYVLTISVAIAIWGDKSSKITRFDMGCLIVVGLIVVFWLFTQNHLVTNFMIQTILVIAYFPVVKTVARNQRKYRTFFNLDWNAHCPGFVVAVEQGDAGNSLFSSGHYMCWVTASFNALD
jgi:hypothetical protein